MAEMDSKAILTRGIKGAVGIPTLAALLLAVAAESAAEAAATDVRVVVMMAVTKNASTVPRCPLPPTLKLPVPKMRM